MAVSGNQAKITEFSITYRGITYTSTDPIIPITDLEPAYAYIPPCTESGEYEPPPPPPPWWTPYAIFVATSMFFVFIAWKYLRDWLGNRRKKTT